MQVRNQQSQDEVIQILRRQVDELTVANLVLQEQLAHTEQFNAMIVHELRGPLTPIITYAQIVARPNQSPEIIQRGTSIIMSQARRLLRIVDDFLDASYLSFGQFTLRREMCDVAALAKEVVEQLSSLAPHHNIVVEIPDTPVTGNWDAGRLQQVLGNLLDNAIKYSDEGTTITVQVSITHDLAHASVHNYGVTIPSAEVSQLFRPYTRLQTSRMRQGSGLGLYITKCIVEAHGGALRLEPHLATSQGTTFSFDLPRQ